MMIKKFAATVLVAAAASALMAAPAGAATSSATVETTAGVTAQLIRNKLTFGRCKDTCRINVRVTNISRKYLYNVKLNATLRVNGRHVGSCYDYVGTIRPRKVRYTACTVRTGALVRAWNNHLDGNRFRYYAKTNVSYRYYR